MTMAKKKPTKTTKAKAKTPAGSKLPPLVQDEYEDGQIIKVDHRGPTIIWVYTEATFDVWKQSRGVWEQSQSTPRKTAPAGPAAPAETPPANPPAE